MKRRISIDFSWNRVWTCLFLPKDGLPELLFAIHPFIKLYCGSTLYFMANSYGSWNFLTASWQHHISCVCIFQSYTRYFTLFIYSLVILMPKAPTGLLTFRFFPLVWLGLTNLSHLLNHQKSYLWLGAMLLYQNSIANATVPTYCRRLVWSSEQQEHCSVHCHHHWTVRG